MTDDKDVRWLQRYYRFKEALSRLTSVTDSDRAASDLSDLEKSGLIRWFEFSYELAWKVMQDLLVSKGYEFVKGPNGTLQMALQDGLISDQDGWREMAKARTMAAHTYDEDEANEIVERIYSEFSRLLTMLSIKLAQEEQAL